MSCSSRRALSLSTGVCLISSCSRRGRSSLARRCWNMCFRSSSLQIFGTECLASVTQRALQLAREHFELHCSEPWLLTDGRAIPTQFSAQLCNKFAAQALNATQTSSTRSAINQRQIQWKRQNTKYITCGTNGDSQCNLQSATKNMEGKEKTAL